MIRVVGEESSGGQRRATPRARGGGGRAQGDSAVRGRWVPKGVTQNVIEEELFVTAATHGPQSAEA